MPSSVNIDEMEKEWNGRGFSCALWTDPPDQHWQNYVHPVDELLMLVAGEIELEVNGKMFRPAIGEEILIPANVFHSVKNVGNTRNRWLYGYKARLK